MLITLIVIIGLSILILTHEAGHFFAAKIFKMRIDEFGFGFPPRLKAWRPFDKAQGKPGETEYSLNALPFGGFVKIAGENDHMDAAAGTFPDLPESERQKFFFAQPFWRRSVVILAGIFVNFVTAWLLLSAILFVGADATLLVSQVQPNSPAAAAGIQVGDVLYGFSSPDDFIGYVQEHKGEEITVTTVRSGERMEFRLTPRTETAPGEGAVGVAFSGIEKRGLFTALKDGFLELLSLIVFTLLAFRDLFANLFTTGALPQDVVGLVGIFPVAQQVGGAGLIYVFQLLAVIAVNLAVVNLMPFPALDGGRFLFLVLEKIKGSPLPRKAEAYVNTAGFVILITLMVVITARDIIRL